MEILFNSNFLMKNEYAAYLIKNSPRVTGLKDGSDYDYFWLPVQYRSINLAANL